MKVKNMTVQREKVCHGVTVRTCQAVLDTGRTLKWMAFSEPNQPDFRMLKTEKGWVFPATECQGYFGLSESSGTMLKAVRPAHRFQMPFIDRGGNCRRIWVVDAVGLAKLLKRAKVDRKSVFVNRMADLILPVLYQSEESHKTRKNRRIRLLERAKGVLMDQNSRLKAQLADRQDVLNRLKAQIRKLEGQNRELAVFLPVREMLLRETVTTAVSPSDEETQRC